MPDLQEIIDSTFMGLQPAVFGEGARFVVLGDTRPPKGFERSWSVIAEDDTIDDASWASEQQLARTTALIVLAHPKSEALRAVLGMLASHLRLRPCVAPPVLLVPIGLVEDAAQVRDTLAGFVRESVVDDIVWGGLVGYAFALAVRGTLHGLALQLERFRDQLDARAATLDARGQIESSMDFAKWQYLRMRLLHALPHTRHDIEDPVMHTIAGYRLGHRITRGAFGFVHAARRAEPTPARGAACTGILVIDKRRSVRTFRDMNVINTFMLVAERLRLAEHRGISRISETFCTPSHMYVCMELCGPRTLFARLCMRDSQPKGVDSVPIAAHGMQSLMAQLCAAICHLHIAADICHRDCKPENVSIREQANGRIDVKLFGFELAAVQSEGRKCRFACGTMPFAAPEIILAGRHGHDGKAADMWSLGVLLLEVACGLRSVEGSLSPLLPPQAAQRAEQNTRPDEKHVLAPTEEVARKVQDIFRDPGFLKSMLGKTVPEASCLKPWLAPALRGLVEVDVQKRLTATTLQPTVE